SRHGRKPQHDRVPNDRAKETTIQFQLRRLPSHVGRRTPRPLCFEISQRKQLAETDSLGLLREWCWREDSGPCRKPGSQPVRQMNQSGQAWVEKRPVIAVKVHSTATGQGESWVNDIIVLAEDGRNYIGVIEARDVHVAVKIRLERRSHCPCVRTAYSIDCGFAEERMMPIVLDIRSENVEMSLAHRRTAKRYNPAPDEKLADNASIETACLQLFRIGIAVWHCRVIEGAAIPVFQYRACGNE